MKRLARGFATVSACLVAVVITGCTTPTPGPGGTPPTQREPQVSQPAAKPAPPSPPPPMPPVRLKTAAEAQLDEGIALFDVGDFDGSIRKLMSASDLWSAPVAMQTQGLKYLAFNYCVTKRITSCRQEFEKALALDPSFDLAPAEKTHPIWGPQFDRAKNRKPGAPKAPSSATPVPSPNGTRPKQPAN